MVVRYACCSCEGVFFFFKQKTAYEMRISDWSSDVCSSDLRSRRACGPHVRDARWRIARAGEAMTFLDILRTAIHALRGNWMRSALTSLGVIIGIAAVIVMVSVGQGTQREIDSLVSGLGSQRMDISPGSRRGPGGARQSASSFYTLGEGDVAAARAELQEVQ